VAAPVQAACKPRHCACLLPPPLASTSPIPSQLLSPAPTVCAPAPCVYLPFVCVHACPLCVCMPALCVCACLPSVCVHACPLCVCMPALCVCACPAPCVCACLPPVCVCLPCVCSHVPAALELLCDCVINPAFRPEELEEQKMRLQLLLSSPDVQLTILTEVRVSLCVNRWLFCLKCLPVLSASHAFLGVDTPCSSNPSPDRALVTVVCLALRTFSDVLRPFTCVTSCHGLLLDWHSKFSRTPAIAGIL
jgi:hypothetical protein